MAAETPYQILPTRPDALTRFCHHVLGRIPRADQRRWAELYVRGLASLSGRKSVRQIAGLVGDDGTEQSLQQFVNQSPWNWRPVRRDLALYAESCLRPQAWVVTDFALPKNGNASVGVDRQYAHSLGRVINCQTGVSLFLTSEDAAVPIDWRLHLPQSWDANPQRRQRAHLPERERHHSRWEYVMSMIDEALSWGITPVPVSLDCSHDLQVDRLISALEERSLRYMIRVGSGARIGAGSGPGEPMLTAGAVAAQARHGGEVAVMGQNGTRRGSAGSRFILCQLPATRPARDQRVQPRQLLVEARPRHRPDGLWLTNLGGFPLPRQASLTELVTQVRAEMDQIKDCFGLGHFEGRSFRGWHHHATLVSLAQAFVTVTRRTSAAPSLA